MFDNYPTMKYNLLTADNQLVIDYFYRTEFFYNFQEKNLQYFTRYTIKDFDTPEDISSRYYQDQKYWFLILIINKRIDPFFDWILSNDELLEYAQKFVTENYSEVSSYVASYPEILTNINSQFGSNYTSYTPADYTDPEDVLVKALIGTYYNILSDENNERRALYLPDRSTMQRLYTTYMNISSQFGR